MENLINAEWLENAQLNFEEALWRGDYETCVLVIADVRDISEVCADTLQEQLDNTPASHFLIPSNFIVI